MGKDILRAESVVKILNNKVILYDASFTVKQGEIFGLIGPSGSGKTTLLRVLVGFFKPEKGDVVIRSEHIPNRQHELYTTVSDHNEDVKRVFGFASQHPSIYMDLSTEENLRYFASLHGISGKLREKRMNILLKLMDLEHARETKGRNLSGGMQRRLDIACAMIHQPKILILDEPTADLDPFLQRHIWDMIRKINQQGTTIVVSSHALADVEMICDRIGFVKHGRMLAVDSPQNIKDRYIKSEKIRVQTYPGHYGKLTRMLLSANIETVEKEGQELVITTQDAKKTLKELMSVIQEAKESLTSIQVQSGSLDQVFWQIAEESDEE